MAHKVDLLLPFLSNNELEGLSADTRTYGEQHTKMVDESSVTVRHSVYNDTSLADWVQNMLSGVIETVGSPYLKPSDFSTGSSLSPEQEQDGRRAHTNPMSPMNGRYNSGPGTPVRTRDPHMSLHLSGGDAFANFDDVSLPPRRSTAATVGDSLFTNSTDLDDEDRNFSIRYFPSATDHDLDDLQFQSPPGWGLMPPSGVSPCSSGNVMSGRPSRMDGPTPSIYPVDGSFTTPAALGRTPILEFTPPGRKSSFVFPHAKQEAFLLPSSSPLLSPGSPHAMSSPAHSRTRSNIQSAAHLSSSTAKYNQSVAHLQTHSHVSTRTRTNTISQLSSRGPDSPPFTPQHYNSPSNSLLVTGATRGRGDGLISPADRRYRAANRASTVEDAGLLSVQPGWQRTMSQNNLSASSKMLQDYRNGVLVINSLHELGAALVDFAQDACGVRLVQQRLSCGIAAEISEAVRVLRPYIRLVATDNFGNHVVQKILSLGSEDDKGAIFEPLHHEVLRCALDTYGCRVIQRALETLSEEQVDKLVAELKPHVLRCVEDQNGNHVIQRILECLPPTKTSFIIKAMQGNTKRLSAHSYGCRVTQRILEHLPANDVKPLLEELAPYFGELSRDQFGNYVVQHVLKYGAPEYVQAIVKMVCDNIAALACHKFSSNVVEKCLSFNDGKYATPIVQAALKDSNSKYTVGCCSRPPILKMVRDPFGNYVVQRMLSLEDSVVIDSLVEVLEQHLQALKKFTYGKHIATAVERCKVKARPIPSTPPHPMYPS